MTMMRLRREDPRSVGPYRLTRRLGAGGMGVVYLGSDRRGQKVALKLIRSDLAEDHEFRSRFAREVSAASRIRGACTVPVVAADLEAARPWLATAYVPGPSLYKKVGADGPLPPAEVAALGATLAEGLARVHEAGVVHRDLKPSNILLSPKGPRIIDFGIAWSTGASTLTHVGTAIGSPGFLAPEQVRGAPVTSATDVFAFGVTLAYAATGGSPFGSGTSQVLLYRVVHEEPDLSGIPKLLAPVVGGCLEKEPADRPTTLQLAAALRELAGDAGRARPREARPRAPRPAPQERSSHSADASARAARPHDGASGGRPAGGAAAHPDTSGVRVRRGTAQVRPSRGSAVASGPRTRPAAVRRSAADAAKPSTGSDGARRAAGRSGSRPVPGARGGRSGVAGGSAPRRGPASARARMLRQRVVIFITVTLLAALGIAVAQGCQGPGDTSKNGMGTVSVTPAGSGTAPLRGTEMPG